MSKHIDLIKIQEELGLRKEARVLIPGRPIKKMLGHLWKRYIKNPTVPHPHPTHKVDRIKRLKRVQIKLLENFKDNMDEKYDYYLFQYNYLILLN